MSKFDELKKAAEAAKTYQADAIKAHSFGCFDEEGIFYELGNVCARIYERDENSDGSAADDALLNHIIKASPDAILELLAIQAQLVEALKASKAWHNGEKWRDSSDPSEVLAWSIHQRALAMAPKKEADHINDGVKMVCPARWKLVPVVATYEMERAAANGPGRSTGAHMESPSLIWKSMLDAAPTAPAAANSALTEEQIVCALGCIANGRNAGYISTENAKVVREFIRAAAGPDAALVKALEGALAVIDDYLTYTHDGDPWKEDARAMGEMDINDADNDGRIESWRAALSGAKGNS